MAVTTLAVAVKAKRRAKVGLMLRMCILKRRLDQRAICGRMWWESVGCV